MAHRGREYKRWRRLDFSVNADLQRTYWPEAFKLTIFGIVSDFWKLNRFQNKRLLNLSMAPDNVPLWRSDALTTTPAGIRAEVSFPAFEGSGTATFHFTILNELDFRILDLVLETDQQRSDYTAYQSHKILTTVVKDSEIHIQPANLLVGITFMEYGEYNP